VTTGNVRSWTVALTSRTETAAGIERRSPDTATTYRALLGQLPTREPRRYLYDYLGSAVACGQGLRPALASPPAAFGRSIEQALPSAVSIELLHNAFLVHDDIEDGSLYRRNRATLYIEQGVPIAVNVGDAMNAISIGSLTENIPVLGAELAYRIFHEAQHLVLQSVEGQALELGWTRDNFFDLTEDDYLRLVLKKTLVHVHPPLPHRSTARDSRRDRRRPLQPVRFPARRGVPDPGRHPEPGWR
jgi:geranylgeranyl diphosphate synthase type II